MYVHGSYNVLLNISSFISGYLIFANWSSGTCSGSTADLFGCAIAASKWVPFSKRFLHLCPPISPILLFFDFKFSFFKKNKKLRQYPHALE